MSSAKRRWHRLHLGETRSSTQVTVNHLPQHCNWGERHSERPSHAAKHRPEQRDVVQVTQCQFENTQLLEEKCPDEDSSNDAETSNTQGGIDPEGLQIGQKPVKELLCYYETLQARNPVLDANLVEMERQLPLKARHIREERRCDQQRVLDRIPRPEEQRSQEIRAAELTDPQSGEEPRPREHTVQVEDVHGEEDQGQRTPEGMRGTLVQKPHDQERKGFLQQDSPDDSGR